MMNEDVDPAALRVAVPGDVPGMQRVRAAVRENRLVSRVITNEEVLDAITREGRGFVVVDGQAVLGFAIGLAASGRIWALFVDPPHEGRGHGRRLHDAVVGWLFAQGHERLALGTEPATRAEAFYRRAGWRSLGINGDGEMEFALDRAQGMAP